MFCPRSAVVLDTFIIQSSSKECRCWVLKSRLFPPLMKHFLSYNPWQQTLNCSEAGAGHLINWLLCSPAPADNFSNRQNKKLLNSNNNKQSFFASFVAASGMAGARNENNKRIDFWVTSGPQRERERSKQGIKTLTPKENKKEGETGLMLMRAKCF